MAHEFSHIRHHDIKLTLMVAVLSNILLIVVDILFYSLVFAVMIGAMMNNSIRDGYHSFTLYFTFDYRGV